MDDSRARSILDAERERLGTIETDLRSGGTDQAGEDDERPEHVVIEQHPTDVGTETHDRSRDLGLLEQVETELRDIEDALRRLEEGTYGQCEVCGQPIPDERLEANPTARFDIEHERARESGALGGGAG
ncbi:MAG: hypothetical protein NVS1B12_09890 [Acidimicrobiales bacterium]